MKKNIKIMVVDDEESVRNALLELLEALGYENVIAIGDPQKGINFICDNPDKINFLITDRRMPEMWGEAMIREVKLLNPAIKSILITGDILNDTEKTVIKAAGAAEILTKPVRIEELEEALKRILK
ncbi:MAG: response regulator [bacterium]|nr:response regulator [bacterium]